MHGLQKYLKTGYKYIGMPAELTDFILFKNAFYFKAKLD